MKRRPLGEILIQQGVVDEHQLRAALAHQRQWGTPLGQAVVDLRFCARDTVLRALAEQAALPAIALDADALDSTVAPLLPRKAAEQHRAVPLRVEGARGEVLAIAIAAPASLDSLDELLAVSGKKRLNAFLADDASIERAIGRIYLGYDKADARVATPSRGVDVRELEFDLKPVLVYGWTEEAGRNLALVLAADGLEAKVATAQEVLSCEPDDVVITPLPAIERITPAGQRARGRVVVIGKAPEEDLPRAQLLGALGFIAAPVDTALLLRSIRRCRALRMEATAHAA